MANNSEKVAQKAEEIETKARRGVSEAADKIDQALDGTSSDVDRAAKRAEDEVNKLKAELADLKRRAGPKIQEAENYLTSPTAISFYKGLITGAALVFAYKKYINTNSRLY
jgi:molecular chaperone GrpE (heat shock protein)